MKKELENLIIEKEAQLYIDVLTILRGRTGLATREAVLRVAQGVEAGGSNLRGAIPCYSAVISGIEKALGIYLDRETIVLLRRIERERAHLEVLKNCRDDSDYELVSLEKTKEGDYILQINRKYFNATPDKKDYIKLYAESRPTNDINSFINYEYNPDKAY